MSGRPRDTAGLAQRPPGSDGHQQQPSLEDAAEGQALADDQREGRGSSDLGEEWVSFSRQVFRANGHAFLACP
eukprot:6177205-Pyramimonas_sp.AAC.1